MGVSFTGMRVSFRYGSLIFQLSESNIGIRVKFTGIGVSIYSYGSLIYRFNFLVWFILHPEAFQKWK